MNISPHLANKEYDPAVGEIRIICIKYLFAIRIA